MSETFNETESIELIVPDEIEFKVLEINQKQVEERLVNLEAEKTFDGDLHDTYIDTERRTLHNLGFKLRIREKTTRNPETGEIIKELEVTLKGKKSTAEGTRKRPEINATVPDREEALITALIWIHELVDPNFNEELKEKYNIKKHRVSYKLNGFPIDIDDYHEDEENGVVRDLSRIPIFLEIEIPNPSLITEAKKMAEDELNLTINEEHSLFSTKQVIKYYKKLVTIKSR